MPANPIPRRSLLQPNEILGHLQALAGVLHNLLDVADLLLQVEELLGTKCFWCSVRMQGSHLDQFRQCVLDLGLALLMVLHDSLGAPWLVPSLLGLLARQLRLGLVLLQHGL